jgi:hypothetical protein
MDLALTLYGALSVKFASTTTVETETKVASGAIKKWQCLIRQAIGDVGVVEDVRVAGGLSLRTAELFGRGRYAGYLFSAIGRAERGYLRNFSIVLRVAEEKRTGPLGPWCLFLRPVWPRAYRLTLARAFEFESPSGKLSVNILADTDGRMAFGAAYRLLPEWEVSVSAVFAGMNYINSLPKLGLTVTVREQGKCGEGAAR